MEPLQAKIQMVIWDYAIFLGTLSYAVFKEVSQYELDTLAESPGFSDAHSIDCSPGGYFTDFFLISFLW
jgi:hypothetical protein